MPERISLDLILDDDIQKLLDNFASVVKARVVFFGADGRVLKRGRGEGNCGYCQLIQRIFSIDDCLRLDHAKQALAARSRRCESYVCHACLWEAVMPIWSDRDLFGFVVFGQCRTRRRLPEEFLAGVPADMRTRLQREFRRLPCFSQEELENLTGLMKLLVDHLIRGELIRRGGDFLYRGLMEYLDGNLDRDILIADAARHLGRSVSTLVHFLHAKGHRSFKQILIGKRMDRADDLLRRCPELTIKEIALRCGFADPGYFSRAYRRCRGTTPRDRRRLDFPDTQAPEDAPRT